MNRKLLNNTWIEVDTAALRHNLRCLKKAAGKGTKLLGVVKANAYGHGMVEVARILRREKIDWLGVADVKEGIELRQKGVGGPILVFENILPFSHFINALFRYRLTPTVCSIPLAKSINRVAKRQKRRKKIHLKIDTGMGRLGVGCEDFSNFVKEIKNYPFLDIEGIYTHFPVADTNRAFTRKQVNILKRLKNVLAKEGIVPKYVHAANSMGLVSYHFPELNLARVGLMMYGLHPISTTKRHFPLKPVMAVKSRITFLKEVRTGQSISYGRTFIASRPIRVAVIPLGYNDGYCRLFSNKASVLIHGKRCPVVGRVTMDMTMVDVSKVKGVSLGDEVVICGKQGKSEISVDELARLSGTINYEVVCHFGACLPHVYL